MARHKGLVFYFTFYDDSTEAESTYGFIIQDPASLYAQLRVSSFNELNEILYDRATEELESNFGVHDWSTRPSDVVDAIGYTSYEVGPAEIGPLMAAWNKWFSDNAGKPTAVVQVSDADALGDDFDMYEVIAGA